jgi:hypothetical protein
MAQTKTRSRGKTAGTTRRKPNPSRRRISGRSAPGRSSRASSAARRSLNAGNSRRSRSNASRAVKARSKSASRPSTNGVTGTIADVGSSIGSAAEKAGDSVVTVAQKAKVPALLGTAAAAGVAGGVALSRRAGGSSWRGNGPFKSVAHEMQEVGKEIGKAGFRLGVGDVNVEVQRGRREKRDSPLEVLLNGLTARRSKR